VNTFASGSKKSYYGKGDVIAYRLDRDGKQPAGENPVFGASVKILIYGDAFWPTYTIGDNTSLIATDSMKNYIQRETMNFTGYDLESYCQFLAGKFMDTYPQAAGVQLSASEIPYAPLSGTALAFAPGGPERAHAVLELAREGSSVVTVEARSGIVGFRLLRLSGSAFHGFVRDQYTTLPDIRNRPLHMWLDLNWQATGRIPVTNAVRRIVHEVFAGFESGSIQQIIYQIGQKMLADIPTISEIHLEANNRTWDTIAEEGDSLGVYTEARPPYGCLGLTLTR
jgi:urate oxidase / 2-oxo-4-hydroxy-4-carboxy-5-ureidoimidazoline decarboxylase